MSEEKKQENIKNKDIKKQKSLRIITNKIVFNNDLIVYVLFTSILLNPYI